MEDRIKNDGTPYKKSGPRPKVKPYIFKYVPGPVATRFHLDMKSRVKFLLGVLGCVSGDTEYLTPAGWRRFDEYNHYDAVAEFNLNTKAIEFHTPLYVKKRCDEFHHLKSTFGIDQLLSEEHTVLYNTRWKPDEWCTINAGDLARQHNSLKDGFSGRIPTTFRPPLDVPGVGLTDAELRLMVAISADGSYPKAARTPRCTITIRKERKKLRLRMLLLQCGIEWDERINPNRPTEFRFVFNAPERNKDLTRYYGCTASQLALVVDEFPYWDGHIDKYGGKMFCSTVKGNADFIQYALTTQGIRASLTRKKNAGNRRDSYEVYGNTGATELSLRQAPKIETVPSVDGFKYCFETSTGFFVARRNGQIFITGNTGKTSSGSYELAFWQSKRIKPDRDGIRRSKFGIVRNTIPQLKKTTIRTFLEWFPTGQFGTFHETDRIYKMSIEDREIEFLFCALDDDKAVRDLLSLDLTDLWVDEARETTDFIFKNLQTRCHRFPSYKNYDTTDPRYYLSPNDWLTYEAQRWQGFDPDKFQHLLLKNCVTCARPRKQRGQINNGVLCTEKDGSTCKIFVSRFSPYIVPTQSILTSNYTNRESWLYRDFLANPIAGYSIYEQGQAENAHNLDKDYYSNMEKDLADRPDLLRTLVWGEWGVTIKGKQVFPEFVSQVHVSKEPLKPERAVRVIVGWDNTGLSPAITLSYINNLGQWCIFKEFVFAGTGIIHATEAFLIYCDANLDPKCEYRHIGDPAGKNRDSSKRSPADYISGKANDYGKRIEIEDGVQTWKVRRESVAGMLGAVDTDETGRIIRKRPRMINSDVPAVLIDPSCITLIDGFEGAYSYPDMGNGKFGTTPKKPEAHTDIQDALQYPATILFPTRRARREQQPGLNMPGRKWGCSSD